MFAPGIRPANFVPGIVTQIRPTNFVPGILSHRFAPRSLSRELVPGIRPWNSPRRFLSQTRTIDSPRDSSRRLVLADSSRRSVQQIRPTDSPRRFVHRFAPESRHADSSGRLVSQGRPAGLSRRFLAQTSRPTKSTDRFDSLARRADSSCSLAPQALSAESLERYALQVRRWHRPSGFLQNRIAGVSICLACSPHTFSPQYRPAGLSRAFVSPMYPQILLAGSPCTCALQSHPADALFRTAFPNDVFSDSCRRFFPPTLPPDPAHTHTHAHSTHPLVTQTCTAYTSGRFGSLCCLASWFAAFVQICDTDSPHRLALKIRVADWRIEAFPCSEQSHSRRGDNNIRARLHARGPGPTIVETHSQAWLRHLRSASG